MTEAIAKTASITLLTGLPGSGKTLRMVHFIKQALAEGEVVFVCNLNGLKLPCIPFEDPRKWREVPAGSVLVVDEAQQFFRTRRGGDAPEYIAAMETIRHAGVRLVLATQQPDYLDTHLRGLVGLHEHLLREGGKSKVTIFRHNEVMDNVRSAKARGRYDSEVWDYPQSLFALYESAQVHTVKRVMSSRMRRGLIFAAVTVGLIGAAFALFNSSRPKVSQDKAVQTTAAGRGDAVGRSGLTRSRQISAVERHEPAQVEEYIANINPRVRALPWTAPVFDDRKAQSDPRVFCMSSEAGIDAAGNRVDASFSCISEQGTRVSLEEIPARHIARWGEAYNPFRKPVEVAAQADGHGAKQDAAASRSVTALIPSGTNESRSFPETESYEVKPWTN